MPLPLTYPGVYVEEIASGVRTITGVSTATTAFVGRALKGPVDKPVVIHSFTDFDRIFGGLWINSSMSFAVNHYFANGGSEAVIVRVFNGPASTSAATFVLSGGLTLVASSPGIWGNDLTAVVQDGPSEAAPGRINIVVTQGTSPVVTLETIRNVSLDATSPFYVEKILEQQSQYLLLAAPPTTNTPFAGSAQGSGGDDGGAIDAASIVPGSSTGRHGIYALDTTDIFNLLCLPPPQTIGAIDWSTAAAYCESRRAMLLVDAPDNDPVTMKTTIPTVGFKKNAAIFYPRIQALNPLNPTLIEDYVPCGAVAGVFARTDAQRGVWKAPAGVDATLSGVLGLSRTLTDAENGSLNPLGVNCLRTFPLIGSVVWGARTMDGADALASESKYIPVRRTTLYIEESLYRGLKWVVFEPNAAPLWAQIRLNVGAFMNNLFRQGAFQGTSPRDAYFVKCDGETTTQSDINLGIVNIHVGFAPLKPAEFVVIQLQQMAGQIAV
jgi:phage tail sheath protein FI